MSDSLKKRFSYKLITNFIGLICSLLVAGIVPRSLGPAMYGNYSFLTNFFTRIFSFFDTGPLMAFYTKLSQYPSRYNLIKFYWGFVGLIGLVVTFIIISISFSNLHQLVFPDQKLLFIWMAFIWGFLMWVNKIIVHMIDAYALTVKGEILSLIQKIIRVIIIFIMLWLGLFTLFNFFIFQYVTILFLFIGLLLLLKKNSIPFYPKEKLESSEIKTYVKEFYTYSKPLLFLSLVGLIVGIFDRWILQNYAGSVQQGYYGLSFRIASLCFLFTSAITPLILREFTIAFRDKDFVKIKKLYLKFTPLFFFIATYIAIFVSLQSSKISIILGGSKYQGAHSSIMIMALYPMHQTFGQINGSFFLATNNTKLYSNIGIIFNLIGLLLIFFMIAPSNLYGLNLGSIGLALKMVIIQIIAINVEIWYISKRLKFSFKMLFKMQFLIFFVIGISSYGTLLIGNYVFNNMIVSFFFSGVLYSIIVFTCIYLFPSIINSSRFEIVNLIKTSYIKIYSVLKK